MDILKKIVLHKKKEIEHKKKAFPPVLLEKSPLFYRKVLSLKQSLSVPESTGIIAEFKRASPSKGVINANAIPEDVVTGYEKAGPAGISILTEKRYFNGRNNDLITARRLTSLPILRKDFIIDEYQILEAKAIGADVILLIAAVMKTKEITKLANLAKKIGMEILFEVHDASELTSIPDSADMVGVNNRDLKTFEVNTHKAIELASLIPEHMLKVSESGISKTETIALLRNHGYKGFLMGETFMRTANPGKTCSDFIKQLSFV